jgi:hypothetical protein
MHDRRRGGQPGSERCGDPGHGWVRNREEGHLGRRQGRGRLAASDELTAVAGSRERPGQRAPEASAADDQEVDWAFG